MSKVHSFKKSLSEGEKGEYLFLQAHPHFQKQDKGGFDFLDPHTGDTYELKSDSYGLSGSPNFFMERWSDFHKKTSGGPWRALELGATFFCYAYPKDSVCFKFKTEELVKALEASKWSSVSVKNVAWTTVGFKVPRAAIEHLASLIRYK